MGWVRGVGLVRRNARDRYKIGKVEDRNRDVSDLDRETGNKTGDLRITYGSETKLNAKCRMQSNSGK